MRKPIPLLGEQSTSRVAKVNDQQTINLYPQVESGSAKSQLTLLSTPGLSKITTVGTGPSRANPVRWKGNLYGISGDSVWKMNTAATVSVVGTLNTSVGWCNLTGGRTHLGIVDGTNGYYCDGSTTTQIADADFPNGATHISYLDSYFICSDPGTDQFFISASEDITSWAALDFASAESNPDDIYAHISNEKDLYMFGDETIQVFYNSGNADFPFSPYPDVIEYGIQAKYSLAKDESGLYCLAIKPGGGLVVVKISGLQGAQLSSPDMTWTINQLSITNDAIGAIYNMKGQSYYVLTFPSEDVTYAFNTQTGLSHRLKSFGIGRHRALGYGSLGTRQFVGDYDNAKVYELLFSTYTEDSAVIERYRRARVIHFNNQRIQYHQIVIDVKAGVGNAGEANPVMELRFSDDGGNTWSNWQSKILGATGEYSTRCVWNRLGTSRGRTFEFRCTDPVEFEVIDAFATVEVLGD